MIFSGKFANTGGILNSSRSIDTRFVGENYDLC